MRKLLIGVNIVLGVVVFCMFISNLSSLGKNDAAYVVKRNAAKKQAVEDSGRSRNKLVIAPEKQIDTIIEADIFDTQRTPNAAMRGRGRTQITLVGTFKVGNSEGAIILQQISQRQQQNNTMGAMMSAEAMRSMMENMRNENGGRQPGRMGSMRQRWSMINPSLAQLPPGANRAEQIVIKQYVRIGDTIANGYTLTEVSRTRAVLTNGGDRMELELQDPTKSMNAARNANRQPRRPSMQQAVLNTQQQMVRTLMMIQRNMGGGGGGRGGRR